MSFSKKYKTLDTTLYKSFLAWLKSEGKINLFGATFGGHSIPDIYLKFLGPKAKNRAGFEKSDLKKVSDMRFVVDHTLRSEGKVTGGADIPEKVIANDNFMTSTVGEVISSCDVALGKLFDRFLKSKMLEAEILKIVKGSKLADGLGLKKTAEKELVPAVIAQKLNDRAGWSKIMKEVEKKHKLTKVDLMAREIQKKIDAQGKSYKVPMPSS